MKSIIKASGLILIASISSASLAADDVEILANTCVACHGDAGNSSGPAIPNLAGVSPNYFMAAMLAYKYEDEDELDEVIDGDEAYEDVEAFTRYSTIMGRIAKGYSEDQIKAKADYFSNQAPQRPTQSFDADLAAAGKKLHDQHCDKCHENEGRSAEDDTGVLAGQWQPYFIFTMNDFNSGDRGMPKKMKKELEEIAEQAGDDGIKQLAHYYASITD